MSAFSTARQWFACTPASGWEKGQVENQVQFLRGRLFTPKLVFEDMESLNAWLYLQCDALGSRRHPERQDHTGDAIFAEEKADLRPLGRAFDGYAPQSWRDPIPSAGDVRPSGNRDWVGFARPG